MERKLIVAAVSSALALPIAAQAVEFSVSGQINRAIISVDGAKNDGELTHVDANSSQTRFRFTGSEELDSGMTAGVQLEYGLTGNVRQANVSLASAGGKLTVGHASTSTDGVAHADLGGPSWLGGATNWCSYHSEITTGTLAVACPSNDGGRSPVLKYDTPAIGPASISLSVGNNDYWDAMFKVAGSMGDAGYDIRIGYTAETEDTVPAATTNQTVRGSDLAEALGKEGFDADADGIAAHEMKNDVTLTRVTYDGDDIADGGFGAQDLYNKYTFTPSKTNYSGDQTTASAAFSFGQGTSVAIAWSQDTTATGKTDRGVEYQYLKLDHSYGDGSIGVYYKRGEAEDGTEGMLWGIGVGHSLGGGATAYAGFRQIQEDAQDDVSLVVAGMRVTFN